MDFVEYMDRVNANVKFLSGGPIMSASSEDTIESVVSAFMSKLPFPDLEQNDGLVRPFAEELIRRRDKS